MSTTQHPEREAGQRFKVEDGSIATLIALKGERWDVEWDNGNATDIGCCTVEKWIETGGWTLIAPAPDRCKAPECHPDCGKTAKEHALSEHGSMEPGWKLVNDRFYCSESCATKPRAPDRSGCKSYCGWHVNELRKDEARKKEWMDDPNSRERYPGVQHCSGRCVDNNLPPIGVPAGKGEAKCACPLVDCKIQLPHDHGFEGPTQPAPAATPAKQKVVKRNPPQAEFSASRSYLEWSARQSGTPFLLGDTPERLPRPRLSHVANLHDDDLLAGEGCAR